MSLRKDVIHSLGWLGSVRLVGQLIRWSITLVVIHILKPSDYGLMELATGLTGLAGLFSEMGLNTALIQKRDLSDDRLLEQVFGFLLMTNALLCVVVLALGPLFGSFFASQRLRNVIWVLALQFPLTSVGVVQDAWLSRQMRFKQISLVNLAVNLSNSAITLTLALSGAGVWALVFGSLGGQVVLSGGLIVAARRWVRPRFSCKGMAELLRFGGNLTTARILFYLYSKADVVIIGKLLGEQTLGFYAVAMQLASVPLQKTSALLQQVGLAAYSSVQTNPEAIRNHCCKATRALSFVAFPIFWGLSAVAPELVLAVLGNRWQAAIGPLQILSLIMPLRMVSHAVGPALEAIGRPGIITTNLLITFIMMPPAFLVGALYGGLNGVALAWVVAYPAAVLIQLNRSLPALGVKVSEYLSAMQGAALGGLVMYLAVTVVREIVVTPFLGPVPALLVLTVVGAATYALVMWFGRQNDCREIIGLIRR